jgi:RNA polymerase sigma-70 factor (ECF subfamily)
VATERDGQNGDLGGFLQGVQRQALALAQGALWDLEAARDVVQESMTRLVQYYRDRPASEWPALFRTIVNSRIQEARRQRLLTQTKLGLVSLSGWLRRDHKSEDEARETQWDPPDPHGPSQGSRPEADLQGLQLGQAIEAALAALPQRQRQVFLLREQLGHSIQETAEILGCSQNSVKQHHFRALRSLRNALEEVWKDERND